MTNEGTNDVNKLAYETTSIVPVETDLVAVYEDDGGKEFVQPVVAWLVQKEFEVERDTRGRVIKRRRVGVRVVAGVMNLEFAEIVNVDDAVNFVSLRKLSAQSGARTQEKT